MSEGGPYTVTFMAETRLAVRVKVDDLKIIVWLPKSKVDVPEGLNQGDTFEVDIPKWIIRNEIGEPDH